MSVVKGGMPDFVDTPMEDYEIRMKTEGVWWLDDEVAFGVAAAQFRASFEHVDQGRSLVTIVGVMTFELKEFGTGAASALPDHN